MTARIAVTGSSGLVGSELVAASPETVIRLVRPPRAPSPGELLWDPARRTLDAAALEGIDAVVHLSGESIAGRRWSPRVKAEIRSSRVDATRLLAESLAKLARKPRVLVAASAIGIYGDRGDEMLDERSAPGNDFLAGVCREWEGAAEPARRAGIRVVQLRFGVILSPRGGALKKMLPPFKLGAGGPIGNGRQWMSWIALDDAVGAIRHALATEALSGAVNCTAPNAVTNAEFARTLGRVLRRPAFAPFPALAVGLIFGELGRALLLSSQRVVPRRLEESGYRFRHPELDEALRFELAR